MFAVAVAARAAVLAESTGVAESAGKTALNPLFGLTLVGEFIDCFYIIWEDAAWPYAFSCVSGSSLGEARATLRGPT